MPPTSDLPQKFFALACEAAGFTHKWEALSVADKARYANGAEAFVRFLASSTAANAPGSPPLPPASSGAPATSSGAGQP
jgi:hypothetical protein